MVTNINIKQLKKSLTIENYKTIFKALGIPLFSENNQVIIYYNLDKHKDLSTAKPKLYFYKDSKVIVSYTMGRSYDIFALVQQRLSILNQPHSFLQAIDFICSCLGFSSDKFNRISDKKIYDWESSLGKFLRIKKGESSLQEYDNQILNEMEKIYYQGWIDEGISIDSMEKYGIGYYDRLHAITIPCQDKEGRLIGVRVRNLEPEKEEQAKYLPLMLNNGKVYKFNTNQVFYGINYNWYNIEETKHCILCEGEKSVLIADTWWHEKSNVLAMFGSNLGQVRKNQLLKMGVNHITIALDSDFHKDNRKDEEFCSYWQKVIKFAEMFRGFCSVDVVLNNIGLDGYKCSPFDFGEEIWNKLWENREIII